jgi:glycosyltransferase involved in cell wall biosynthesis
MKIAFSVVKNLLRGGGIEKYTYELGRRLVQRGHEITVFSMPHYGTTPPEVEGMHVITVPTMRRAATEKLSAGWTAARHVARHPERYDIVHCHSVGAGAFGVLMKRHATATVLQMHGIEWQRSRWSAVGRGVLKSLEWASLHSHDAYTAVSQVQCDFYLKHAGINMAYIPTGANLPPPTSPREILEMGLVPGRYVLFASRLVQEKGAHHLLSAFRTMQTDMKLVVAGDAKGTDDYKASLVALARGDDRILFPGMLEGRKLAELFSHAAVYVQPSEIEGLSIALLEAMSYARCCLTSDIPENKEAIGDTGFTFKSGSPESLRIELERLIARPDTREEIGKRARQRVETHFSWDSATDQFEKLYHETISRRV